MNKIKPGMYCAKKIVRLIWNVFYVPLWLGARAGLGTDRLERKMTLQLFFPVKQLCLGVLIMEHNPFVLDTVSENYLVEEQIPLPLSAFRK